MTLKALMRDIAHDADIQTALRRSLKNPETPGYAQLWKMVASYTVGLPVQTVRIGGLLSVAQRIEGLSEAELDRLLQAGGAELMTALVTAAEEEEDDG